jgi:hypothetical protein
MDNRSIKNTG